MEVILPLTCLPSIIGLGILAPPGDRHQCNPGASLFAVPLPLLLLREHFMLLCEGCLVSFLGVDTFDPDGPDRHKVDSGVRFLRLPYRIE